MTDAGGAPATPAEGGEAVAIDVSASRSTRDAMLYPAGKVRVDSALSLWRAAEHGDVGRLKMLLDAGHDVNALCDDKSVDARCRSVLSAAVDGNEPLAVRLLLRRGANPNLRDGDGDRYPLHWASAYGDHDECAELLVQAGAALEAHDARGHTPLEFARGAADGSVHGFARLGSSLLGRAPTRDKVVAVLERAVARRAERARRGDDTAWEWSPSLAKARLAGTFWKAAASGDLAAMTRCLDEHDQAIDQPRPAPVSRLPALSIAAFNGQTAAVALLLERRANPNAAEAAGGHTPLFFCAHDADRAEEAMMLLRAGADPLRAKHDGELPAAFAQRRGREATSRVVSEAEWRQRAVNALVDALAKESAWLGRPTAGAMRLLVEAARRAEADPALLARGEAATERLAAAERGGSAGGGLIGGGASLVQTAWRGLFGTDGGGAAATLPMSPISPERVTSERYVGASAGGAAGDGACGARAGLDASSSVADGDTSVVEMGLGHGGAASAAPPPLPQQQSVDGVLAEQGAPPTEESVTDVAIPHARDGATDGPPAPTEVNGALPTGVVEAMDVDGAM